MSFARNEVLCLRPEQGRAQKSAPFLLFQLTEAGSASHGQLRGRFLRPKDESLQPELVQLSAGLRPENAPPAYGAAQFAIPAARDQRNVLRSVLAAREVVHYIMFPGEAKPKRAGDFLYDMLNRPRAPSSAAKASAAGQACPPSLLVSNLPTPTFEGRKLKVVSLGHLPQFVSLLMVYAEDDARRSGSAAKSKGRLDAQLCRSQAGQLLKFVAAQFELQHPLNAAEIVKIGLSRAAFMPNVAPLGTDFVQEESQPPELVGSSSVLCAMQVSTPASASAPWTLGSVQLLTVTPFLEADLKAIQQHTLPTPLTYRGYVFGAGSNKSIDVAVPADRERLSLQSPCFVIGLLVQSLPTVVSKTVPLESLVAVMTEVNPSLGAHTVEGALADLNRIVGSLGLSLTWVIESGQVFASDTLGRRLSGPQHSPRAAAAERAVDVDAAASGAAPSASEEPEFAKSDRKSYIALRDDLDEQGTMKCCITCRQTPTTCTKGLVFLPCLCVRKSGMHALYCNRCLVQRFWYTQEELAIDSTDGSGFRCPECTGRPERSAEAVHATAAMARRRPQQAAEPEALSDIPQDAHDLPERRQRKPGVVPANILLGRATPILFAEQNVAFGAAADAADGAVIPLLRLRSGPWKKQYFDSLDERQRKLVPVGMEAADGDVILRLSGRPGFCFIDDAVAAAGDPKSFSWTEKVISTFMSVPLWDVGPARALRTNFNDDDNVFDIWSHFAELYDEDLPVTRKKDFAAEKTWLVQPVSSDNKMECAPFPELRVTLTVPGCRSQALAKEPRWSPEHYAQMQQSANPNPPHKRRNSFQATAAAKKVRSNGSQPGNAMQLASVPRAQEPAAAASFNHRTQASVQQWHRPQAKEPETLSLEMCGEVKTCAPAAPGKPDLEVLSARYQPRDNVTYTWDAASLCVRVDVSRVPGRLNEREKRNILALLDDASVTTIIAGLTKALTPELWTWDYLLQRIGHVAWKKIRVFKPQPDNPSGQYIEDGWTSMTFRQYHEYLTRRWQGVAADLSVVYYWLDFPLSMYMPELAADLKSSAALDLFPGGEHCAQKFVAPSARPDMGPNLYICPPGGRTWFHEDGHGTVDSGHQVISGMNDVIMLRRLTDQSTRMKALHELSETGALGLPHEDVFPTIASCNWPDEQSLRRLSALGGGPSAFKLSAGEFVHINKGRLHAFRKQAQAASAPERPDSVCISVAWDWLNIGSDSKGMAAELATSHGNARINRDMGRESLALSDSVQLQSALAHSAQWRSLESLSNGSARSLLSPAATAQHAVAQPGKLEEAAAKCQVMSAGFGDYVAEQNAIGANMTPQAEYLAQALIASDREGLYQNVDAFGDATMTPDDFVRNAFSSDGYVCFICSTDLPNQYFRCRGCHRQEADYHVCKACIDSPDKAFTTNGQWHNPWGADKQAGKKASKKAMSANLSLASSSSYQNQEQCESQACGKAACFCGGTAGGYCKRCQLCSGRGGVCSCCTCFTIRWRSMHPSTAEELSQLLDTAQPAESTDNMDGGALVQQLVPPFYRTDEFGHESHHFFQSNEWRGAQPGYIFTTTGFGTGYHLADASKKFAPRMPQPEAASAATAEHNTRDRIKGLLAAAGGGGSDSDDDDNAELPSDGLVGASSMAAASSERSTSPAFAALLSVATSPAEPSAEEAEAEQLAQSSPTTAAALDSLLALLPSST